MKPDDFDRAKLRAHDLYDAKAIPSGLPAHSGDGYGYGGGAVVVIGQFTIVIGEGDGAHALARELADRWNRATQ